MSFWILAILTGVDLAVPDFVQLAWYRGGRFVDPVAALGAHTSFCVLPGAPR